MSKLWYSPIRLVTIKLFIPITVTFKRVASIKSFHTGQRPDICSSANFLAFYKNVDFRVSLILLHKEKVISSIKKAENCRFKPVIIIKMFISTAI